MKTPVQKAAGELYDALITSEYGNGDKWVGLKEDSPSWMEQVVRAGHNDRWANNTDYATIKEASAFLSDTDEEYIYEYETNRGGYYQDSLNWLASNVHNLEYLTEAIGLGITDGWQLVITAHHLYGQETINLVLNEIKELIELGEIEMEKYGVKTDEVEGEKTASKGVVNCPRCGTIAENHGGVLKCPKCGTEPFEKEGKENDRKEK